MSLPSTDRHYAIWTSHVLMIITLLMVMWQGLLPGLLSLCVGFLSTHWFARQFRKFVHRPAGLPLALGATIVTVLPLFLIFLGLSRTRGFFLEAPAQYHDLLALMAKTVLELRDRLPPDLARQLPDGAAELQSEIAAHLAAKAGSLANMGRAWLAGLLYAYMGLLIGALAAMRPPMSRKQPLSNALRQRIVHFGNIFKQIMVAQFWIALFNTVLTAIFLMVLLPLWDIHMPYTRALIFLTFVAGLIPIVGNLICNAVLTLVGLSVSSWVAATCLIFLIIIHKMEYFINAKIIGDRIHINIWELLTAMFVLEAIFGPAGLIAAPLYYGYVKNELNAISWV